MALGTGSAADGWGLKGWAKTFSCPCTLPTSWFSLCSLGKKPAMGRWWLWTGRLCVWPQGCDHGSCWGRHPLQFKTWLWFDTNQNLANNSQKRRGCDVCLGNTTEKDGWAGNSVYKVSVKSKLNSATFTYMYYVFWLRFPRVTRVRTANTWVSSFTGIQDSRKYWATPWKSGLF